MINEIAKAHNAEETEVICAWAQAWAALNLAPVFAALDAHALQVAHEVSVAVDSHTRALQKAVIKGVLSVTEQQLRDSAMQELAQLFSRSQAVRELIPTTHFTLPTRGLPPVFGQACETIESITSIADFLFAGLTVPRPEGMDLSHFLQLGMTFRRQVGIDGLERVLLQAPTNASQEPLRDHALQALRRAQQCLLMRVLQAPVGGQPTDNPSAVVEALMRKLKAGRAQTTLNLEHAVLGVWALSEAVSSVADNV